MREIRVLASGHRAELVVERIPCEDPNALCLQFAATQVDATNAPVLAEGRPVDVSISVTIPLGMIATGLNLDALLARHQAEIAQHLEHRIAAQTTIARIPEGVPRSGARQVVAGRD